MIEKEKLKSLVKEFAKVRIVAEWISKLMDIKNCMNCMNCMLEMMFMIQAASLSGLSVQIVNPTNGKISAYNFVLDKYLMVIKKY